MEIILGILMLIAIFMLGAILLQVRYSPVCDLGSVYARFESLEKQQELFGRRVSDDMLGNRQEAGNQAATLRQEVQVSIKGLGETLTQAVTGLSTVQEERLGGFAAMLSSNGEGSQQSAKELREEISQRLGRFNSSLIESFSTLGDLQKGQLDSFAGRLDKLTESNEKKFDSLQTAVEAKLVQIQSDTYQKLEEMRKTVNEKLQGTLEKRLGESFNTVSEQLKHVHESMGEMRNLAQGVGDLKKVLSNVKARGTWGEIAAGNLLEQVLSPEQYAANVCTRPGSGQRVEFAIKLPGADGNSDEPVWLPIDAKFPKEVFERLVDAAELGDKDLVASAGKEFERAVRACACSISEKYLNPPFTTDFGIMFMASEGLYAEVLRRPGLAQELQRNCRVLVCGPTTLAALLNSLQVGFKTLAIQQRSSEVWKVLAAVKTEFGKFGGILEKAERHLKHATKSIGTIGVRSRAMDRKLKAVEALPVAKATRLLGVEPLPESASGDFDGIDGFSDSAETVA